ncbi:hypothetical protein [Cecembia sp.]|uniref:hypothetical protein n=1 Tax=Cecembia sp. TaxID=1898110 RepID=UPI0025C3C9FC|nr:hypothetical protein [Cecembia sp.]
MQPTTYIFKNSQDVRQALTALFKRGYFKKHLTIKFNEIEMNRDEILVHAFKSGDVVLTKTIKGLKLGMLAGSGGIGLIVGLILLFGAGNSLYPLATFVAALFVGAVWGGTLGFILGSLFPFEKTINIKDQSVNGYFSIDLLPINLKDGLYFKNKWQSAI